MAKPNPPTTLKAPRCPYCDGKAKLLKAGMRGYPYRGDYGAMWVCIDDGAWVGCHRDSKTYAPLGRLANAALRKLKIEAHAAFDPLWKGEGAPLTRVAAYAWLTAALDAPRPVHIGYCSEDECRRVIEACRARVTGEPSN